MSRRSSQKAASLVELSLIIVIVLMAVLFLIEVSRYMAIRGILTLAAQRGALTASRVFGMHYEQEDYTVDADEPDDFDHYLAAVRASVADALTVPVGQFLSSSNQDSSAKLLANRIFLQAPESGDYREYTPTDTDVVVLRPGEFYERVEDGSWGNHPTLCHPAAPCPGSLPQRQRNVPMERLMENNGEPIMVLLRASVRPLVPILPNYTVEGVAIEYRDEFKRGAFSVPVPTPPPPPPAIPPTLTPFPPGFTPSATPTRTATATPTGTFFPCICTREIRNNCLRINRCAICPDFADQCICAPEASMCRGGGG